MSPSVWLITGASSGFGKRFAISALDRGERVIATSRSLGKLQVLTSKWASDPKISERLRVLELDVTSGEERIKEVVNEASAFWGEIDVLVNNAGIGLPGLVEECGSKHFRRQFDTNVFGVLDVTTAALPHIRRSNAGRVVIIGSRSEWRPDTIGLGLYAASKAAINSIAETLRAELAPFNIKVLLVLPGAFRTEGIYGQTYYNENPIPDYDPMRLANMKAFGAIAGKELGDPDKAAKAVVDIIKGEGVANGRACPPLLFLGNDAEATVRSKCSQILTALDEWADVTRGVNFDE